MAKRHSKGGDLGSKIARMQEVVMAHTGLDDFQEIVKILLAKFYSEQAGNENLPDLNSCSALLKENEQAITDILEADVELQVPEFVFDELRKLLGQLSVTKQDFSALDDAFEILTARSYKSDKGQYFTPRHVVDMCIKALNPKPGETVCDPACGSAAFLKSTHSHLGANNVDTAQLYGFDYSKRACQVAKLVSLVGAQSKLNISQVDSLNIPEEGLSESGTASIESLMPDSFEGFDVIATNPPFAGDVSGEHYASAYDVSNLFQRRIERDILFVERCIRLLKDGGRYAIVLPDNKVSSKSFSSLRHWLGKNSKIRGVVSLHRYTFLPYTSQKASVIFGVKTRPELTPHNSEVSFFRSDKPGKTSNGTNLYIGGAINDLPFYDALDHDLHEIPMHLEPMICE
ncbi:HsdM family class I SAM-dependent methyltransferase [Epibacterium ulvae]|uniref:HsdM family class I SAM-dependent methyltransferase n=1 Tax=Epibacterium ulvae TaxID=1156985 RepID=UPI00248F58BC|nr:N-6 DNA methylase [Epibacterium ulvae]